MKFELLYAAKPYRVNQSWGVKNDLYKQFGFSRHNGEDVALGTDKCLYAPVNGKVVRLGNQPKGGGIFFSVMTDVYTFPDGEYRVLLDFLHCEKLFVVEGQTLKAGDRMAIADNTGLSTGPHTHIQARRVAYWNGGVGENLSWTPADSNDANNSFDHSKFYTGHYAQDIGTLQAMVQSLLLILQRLVERQAIKK